jgi:phytoene synthase
LPKEHYQITAKSKSNFLYSFSLLPKEKNEAVNVLYAFCRTTDDIVDNEGDSVETKHSKLGEWRSEFDKCIKGESAIPLLNRMGEVIEDFNVPVQPFYDLMLGMEDDLNIKRYNDFEQLHTYCYRVAGTIGLMGLAILGYKTKFAQDYALNLAVAMQLTNIIRDVKSDAESGRIYIPQEDLRRFSYSEDDLLNCRYNNSFIELMKFECERARLFYEKANRNFHRDDRRSLYPVRIIQHIYSGILEKAERMNYDVFSKRPRISNLRKLYITFGVYMKYHFAYS